MTRQEILMQKVRSGVATQEDINELKSLSPVKPLAGATGLSALGTTAFKSEPELKQELQNTAIKELARAKEKAAIDNTLPSGMVVPESAYESLPDDSGTANDSKVKPKLEQIAKGNFSNFMKPNLASKASLFNNWANGEASGGYNPAGKQNDFSAYPITMNSEPENTSEDVPEIDIAGKDSKGEVSTESAPKSKGQKFRDIAKNILEVFQAGAYAKAGVTKPTNIEQRQALENAKEEREYIEKLMQSSKRADEAAAMRRSAFDNQNLLAQLNLINKKTNAGMALTPEEKLLAMKNAQASGSNRLAFIPE
jgi:NADH dehydrogenase/NADH:ubiquinone oxidoreductase subunit G